MAKNPTLKRIMKEAAELASAPSADYHAAPLESDMYDWHFTLLGPPERADGSKSPFAGGMYHGRIVLPPAYPLKPPSFRFLTPTGRFEVNREICLSISGHHEETWQPAWGIRTALVAIRSFMDTDAKGQLGGMDASEEMRKRIAGQSTGWKCSACQKSNAQIMKEQQEAVVEAGSDDHKADELPEELRLAYKDELTDAQELDSSAKQETVASPAPATDTPPSRLGEPTPSAQPATALAAPQPIPPQTQSRLAPPQRIPLSRTVTPETRPPGTATTDRLRRQRERMHQDDGIPPWIDKAIYGFLAMILLLVIKRLS